METVRPIKTQEQYDAVMAKIEMLLDSEPNTTEFELLEVLSILADDYENKICPMPELDPIEANSIENLLTIFWLLWLCVALANLGRGK